MFFNVLRREFFIIIDGRVENVMRSRFNIKAAIQLDWMYPDVFDVFMEITTFVFLNFLDVFDVSYSIYNYV